MKKIKCYTKIRERNWFKMDRMGLRLKAGERSRRNGRIQ